MSNYTLRIGTPAEFATPTFSLAAEAGGFVVTDSDLTSLRPALAIAADGGAIAVAGDPVTLTPSGGLPSDTLMATAWKTDTGSGDAALRDTDREVPWDDTRDPTICEVVTVGASGLTWPAGMTHCFAVTMNASSGSGGLDLDVGTLPVPGVGESLFFRQFLAQVTPDYYINDNDGNPGDDTTHGWGDGVGGNSNNWRWRIYTHGDGTWHPRLVMPGGVSPGGQTGSGYTQWDLDADLTMQVVYGMELEVRRISSTTFQPYPRILDKDGVELYGPEHWSRGQGGSLASGIAYNIVNASWLSAQKNGANGWDTDPYSPFVAFYMGGFMIRTEDYCGRFNAAEEDF